MRASTRKKSQWQKDEEVKGDFYFFSFFSFLDEPSGKKKKKLKGRRNISAQSLVQSISVLTS